jgi:hypothetical protein
VTSKRGGLPNPVADPCYGLRAKVLDPKADATELVVAGVRHMCVLNDCIGIGGDDC